MEVKTNNFTCIYARGFFRICDEQSGTVWIQDSFCLYTKMGESEINCPDLAACPEVLNPIKFSDQKTPANPSILTLLMDPEKKTAVNVAVVGKQTLKAICNLSPPQRFNEALLDYPIANI